MISVCIATHNGGKYIVKQLNSILSQLSQTDEIIISDDGSIDDTIQLIESLNDARIRIVTYRQKIDYTHLRLSSYYYASSNFCNALKYATGDFIFLSDQDDIWKPTKVEKYTEAFKDADMILSNFSIIDENDALTLNRYYVGDPYRSHSFFSILKGLPFRGCCLAFKREILIDAMPFPDKLLLHDCWIGLNAYVNKRCLIFISDPLLLYRRHSSNVSDLNSPNDFVFKITYRIILLSQILKLKIRKLCNFN